MVVADDYGLTAATSEAILACFEAGGITATSVLVNPPGADRALARLAAVPELDAGLHLALVGEDPPMCPAREIPTLVDRRGRLAASWRQLVPRLAAGRVDPGDVERELVAQLTALRAGGVRPTHLNAHQHLQLWPTVGRVVVEVAIAEEIGYVRTPRSTTSRGRGRAVNALAVRLERRIAAAGLATSDAFVGLDEAGRLDRTAVAAALAGPAGRAEVVEVNAHPGADHDDDRARYRWGYAWAAERALLVGLPDLATAQGAELVRPSDLRARRPPGSGTA